MNKISRPLPKYFVLKEYLKSKMVKGHISPGAQLPSENALAKQFTLSRHTVRQALGEMESEGWIRREQGRGTFCVLQRNKANSKPLVVQTTYISDYIFPAIIRGIEEVVRSTGYFLMLVNTNNEKLKEAQCMESLIGQGIEGVIIEPTKSAEKNTNMRYFRELEKRNIPYLMLHATYPELDPAYIIMDDEDGGFMIAKYLLQLGHRRIAGIFKSDDRQGLGRQAGFLKALREYGIEALPENLGSYDTDMMWSFPYQYTLNVLKKNPRPSAIVCYNDQVAIQVLEAIRSEGLKVPRDISVTGYDDSNLAIASEVKLTTIKHPKEEMGRQAARFLIDMVDGRVKKPRLIYKPELIVRTSCRSI